MCGGDDEGDGEGGEAMRLGRGRCIGDGDGFWVMI